MKRYSKPYQIQRSIYESEWSKWSPDPVPHINDRWGERTVIPLPTDNKSNEFYWYDQAVLDSVIQDNTVIYLHYGYFDWQLDELRQSLSRVQDPRILVAFCDLPGPWPDHVKVINTEPLAYQFSRSLVRSGIRPRYHRIVGDLPYRFTIMAMGIDLGRPKFLLMLNRLGLLAHAQHSNPELPAYRGVYVDDDLAINDHLEGMGARVLGDAYVRFDVDQNLRVLPQLFEQANFLVSIDTNPFLDNRISHITEKIMWGVTTATPVIPIWATNKARQMRKWGFLFDNVGYRQPTETEQQAVQRWCERVLLWDRIAQDPDWAQSFENRQGEHTAHNAELARDLHRIIDQDIQRQIDELPAEFQNL